MGNVEILKILLDAGLRLGEVRQAHLYAEGVVTVAGADFNLTYTGEGEISGGAQDVCQDHHRFRCLS